MRIFLETLFYITFTFILALVTKNLMTKGAANVDFLKFLQELFITNQYWFILPYILSYFLFPFINIALNKLNQRQFFFLIAILFIFLSVLPTSKLKLLSDGDTVFSIGWWVMLLLIGSYIRMYPKAFEKNTVMIPFFVLCISIYILSLMMPGMIGGKRMWFVQQRNNVILVLATVSLFCIFKNIKMKEHKWINVWAGASFGVYLFHESYFLRLAIWSDLFKLTDHANDKNFFAYVLWTIIVVYAVGTLIDIFRKYCLEAPLFNALEKKFGNTFAKIDRAFPREKVSPQSEDKPIRFMWLQLTAIVLVVTATRQVRYSKVPFFITYQYTTFMLFWLAFEVIFALTLLSVKLLKNHKENCFRINRRDLSLFQAGLCKEIREKSALPDYDMESAIQMEHIIFANADTPVSEHEDASDLDIKIKDCLEALSALSDENQSTDPSLLEKCSALLGEIAADIDTADDLRYVRYLVLRYKAEKLSTQGTSMDTPAPLGEANA